MLALKVNGEYVDIDGATSATINIIMPLFDRDSFERVYTFPFKLKATPRNKAIFQHNHRLDSRNSSQKYPAELWLEGIQFKVGFVIVTNVLPTSIEVAFKSKSMLLADRLKEINLSRHLDYEVEVTENFCYDEIWVSDYDPEESMAEFIFKINDDLFYAGTDDIDGLADAIEAVYPGLVDVYPYEDFGDVLALIIYRPSCTEGITITTATKPNDTYSNFTKWGNVVRREALRINADWATHLAGTVSAPTTHVFPVVKFPNLYNQKNSSWQNYVNYYTTDEAHAINTVIEGDIYWPYAIIPFFFLPKVLDEIATTAGNYQFGGDLLEDAEMQSLIVHNNRPLDYIVKDNWFDYINLFKQSFNIKDHLPDTSALDFLNAISSMFCQWYNLNGDVIEINFIDLLLQTPIEDWTSKADPMYRASIPENNGFQLDYDKQGEEVTSAGQLENITEGEGGASFTSQMFSLYNATDEDEINTDRLWLIPTTSEQGISEQFNLTPRITKRLLFYRGLQPSDDGGVEVDYPLATHSATNYNGDSIGNYSLEWSGEKGLLATWWQRYIDLTTKGKPVEKLISLTVKDLLEILTYKSIRKKIYHEQGEMVGVIKSVQIKAGMNGLSEARVEFIQEPLA